MMLGAKQNELPLELDALELVAGSFGFGLGLVLLEDRCKRGLLGCVLLFE